jgi:hypothetical protein
LCERVIGSANLVEWPKADSVLLGLDSLEADCINFLQLTPTRRGMLEALEFGAAVGSGSVWLAHTDSVGSRLWEETVDDFCQRAPCCVR